MDQPKSRMSGNIFVGLPMPKGATTESAPTMRMRLAAVLSYVSDPEAEYDFDNAVLAVEAVLRPGAAKNYDFADCLEFVDRKIMDIESKTGRPFELIGEICTIPKLGPSEKR